MATLIGLAAAFAMQAAPVTAHVEMGHTGTVGAHSLSDTGSNNPGATCRYRGKDASQTPYDYEGELVRLNVRAPRVKAIAGSQKVGWQFKVQRQGDGGWDTRFTSGMQKKTTTSSAWAAFTDRGVDVDVPTSGADDSPYYVYRVVVKMLWYRANGSVQGTATHRVEFYKQIFNGFPDPDGKDIHNNETYCEGWYGLAF